LLLCLLFFGRFPELTFIVNRIVGPLFGLYALVLLGPHLRRLPGEVYIFAILVLWSATGLIVAPYMVGFLGTYRLLIQLGILFVIIGGITWKYDCFEAMVWVFVVTASGVLVYTLINGEMLGVVEAYQAGAGPAHVQLSAEGALGNANGFGFLMLVGIMGLVFLFDRTRLFYRKVIIVSWAGSLGVGIVLSASRKSFISMLVFIVLWGLFCHFQKIVSHPLRVMGVMLLLVFMWGAMGVILERTYLGERLVETRNVVELSEKEGKRRKLYLEAWRVTKENPIAGIGLGNFKVVSGYHVYAHSDFAGVLAETGLVGFVLYASIFVVFWRRCQAIVKYTGSSEMRREARYLLAVLIVFLAIGLGRPHFIQIFSMAWFASMIGHSQAMFDRVRSQGC
jgi:O-antigen ligase